MRILVYHDVAEAPESIYAVRPALFASHLSYLCRNGYRCRTIRQVIDRWPESVDDPATVVITFDDGFAGVCTHALPLLSGFGVRATVFVTTGAIASSRQKAPYPAIAGFGTDMLSWSDVKHLHDEGIEIGAHSHTHPCLGGSVTAAEREVVRPKAILEDLVREGVVSFAYPFGRPGSFSAKTVQLVKDAGYHGACTTIHRSVSALDSLFALPRIVVLENTDVARFRGILRGEYDLAFAARDAAARVRAAIGAAKSILWRRGA